MSRDIAAEEWMSLIGEDLGVSPWIALDQDLIDAFAKVTGDDQFIHVDPVRAAADSPFGGTVAHGFLTLSLLPVMARAVLPQTRGTVARINYGFDKVRFLASVPAGSRVRASFTLMAAEERRPGELTLKYEVALEVEGGEGPALVAEWLSRVHYTRA